MKVPAAPVLSIEETVKHPHLRARGTVRTVEPGSPDDSTSGHAARVLGFPDDLPLRRRLGQHNREVLRDLLGRSDEEIQTARGQRSGRRRMLTALGS
jgi:CoA:oxalate CoA-transferase